MRKIARWIMIWGLSWGWSGTSLAQPIPPNNDTASPPKAAQDKAASGWNATMVLTAPRLRSWWDMLEKAKQRGIWSPRFDQELGKLQTELQNAIRNKLKQEPKGDLPALLEQIGLSLTAQVGISQWRRSSQPAFRPSHEVMVITVSADGARLTQMFTSRGGHAVRWLPENQTDQVMMETRHQREWLSGLRFGNRFHFFVRDKEPMFRSFGAPSSERLKSWETSEETFRNEVYAFLREHRGFLTQAIRTHASVSSLKPNADQLVWGSVALRGLPNTTDLEKAQRFVHGVSFAAETKGDRVKASVAVLGQPSFGPFLKPTTPIQAPISIEHSVPSGLLYLQSLHFNFPAFGEIPAQLGRIGAIQQKELFSLYLGYGMVDSVAAQLGIRLHDLWGPMNGQILFGLLDRPWIRESLAQRMPMEAITSPFLLLGMKEGQSAAAWIERVAKVWPKVAQMYPRIGQMFSVTTQDQDGAKIAHVSRRGQTVVTIAGRDRWLLLTASPRTAEIFVQMWNGKLSTLAQSQDALKTALSERMTHFGAVDLGALLPLLPKRAWPRRFRMMPDEAKQFFLTALLALPTPRFGLEAKGNDLHIEFAAQIFPVNEDLKTKVATLLKRLKRPAPYWKERRYAPSIPPMPPSKPAMPPKTEPAVPPTPTHKTEPAVPPVLPTPPSKTEPTVPPMPPHVPSEDRPTPAARPAQKIVPGLSWVGAPSIGPADAPVTIVAFSDFECPFCARASHTVNRLFGDFSGKIRLVFKHRPLSFHKRAKLAAIASMAAHRQGKFWPYHDKLFANFRRLDRSDLLAYARDIGLEMTQFESDLEDPSLQKYVETDDAMGVRVGASGTPTFFINGYRIVGAQPPARFQQAIRELLAGKAPSIARPHRPYRPRAPPPPATPIALAIGQAPTWGPDNAPVTVVIFSDFECPFCSRANRTLDAIKQAYPGQVRFAFKHMPLSFHRNAKPAAIASMAAHRQGKFWEFHDKLFADYRNLNREKFLQIAEQIGLDSQRFQTDLEDPALPSLVEADAAYASRIGVNGTPTFFVNGRKIAGAQPLQSFQRLIDPILKK